MSRFARVRHKSVTECSRQVGGAVEDDIEPGREAVALLGELEVDLFGVITKSISASAQLEKGEVLRTTGTAFE